MKRVILFFILLFFTTIYAFSFEEVLIQQENSISASKNIVPVSAVKEDTPQLITGSVSLLNSVPEGFFGTWKVIAVQVYSNNPFLFNSMSVEFWKLEKKNNNLTLTNPESGATATVTLDEVNNNTIKFKRTSDTPFEKVIETPEITLNGENFYGTDTIIINKYKNDTFVGREMVKFKLRGIKQSGASVLDLISK